MWFYSRLCQCACAENSPDGEPIPANGIGNNDYIIIIPMNKKPKLNILVLCHCNSLSIVCLSFFHLFALFFVDKQRLLINFDFNCSASILKFEIQKHNDKNNN